MKSLSSTPSQVSYFSDLNRKSLGLSFFFSKTGFRCVALVQDPNADVEQKKQCGTSLANELSLNRAHGT